MLILVGETRSLSNTARLRDMNQCRLGGHEWGRNWTVRKPSLYIGEPWMLDNGAYSWYLQGVPFKSKVYLRRIDKLLKYRVPHPRIAVLPDIVAGGNESIDFSVEWIHQLPEGWPWYLVVQDGMDQEQVVRACSLNPQIRGLFLGGTDRFKQTALRWSDAAHRLGLKFHYGRAGTYNKIRAAKHAHSDSLDSSFPLWSRTRFNEFIEMLAGQDPQKELF